MFKKSCETCENQDIRDAAQCRDCAILTENPLHASNWEEHSLVTIGRRAGIEEALQAYRSHSGQSTDAEVRIFALLRRHCGTVESVEPDGSAIVRTGK